MNHRNRKSTEYSTPGNAIASCIGSTNGPVTTIYARAGNWRTTLAIPEIWWPNFTESTLIDEGNRGMEFESRGTENTQAVWTFHLKSCFSSLNL